jgi:hypothetical protein
MLFLHDPENACHGVESMACIFMEQGSRGEGKQGSREAGEQLRMMPYFTTRLLAILENIRLV